MNKKERKKKRENKCLLLDSILNNKNIRIKKMNTIRLILKFKPKLTNQT
jgi:hypothetical protein